MKVEIEVGNNKHACTGNVISCEETGRTIASLWHEGDTEEIANILNTHEKLKEDLARSTAMLNMFIIDSYKCSGGRPSKKTGVALMKYVAQNPDLQRFVSNSDWKAIREM